MKLTKSLLPLALFATFAGAHDGHAHDDDQFPLGTDFARFPYEPIYRGHNGEVTADAIFSGITTFAKLPWVQCLTREKDIPFDVAFIGAPFDTATSYRPGARFGPSGIRAGSRRLTLYGGYNVPLQVNPFQSGLRIVDCGDIPVTPYDNKYAIQQIEDGHKSLLQREAFSPLGNDSLTGEPLLPSLLMGRTIPGSSRSEATIPSSSLCCAPSIRYSLKCVSVLDTWKPSVFGGAPSEQAAINHGTYFYWASQEGLIKNGSSIASPLFLYLSPSAIFHGAIRTTLSGPEDYENDDESGFQRIEAREIDTIGTDGIIKRIRETVGDNPVYLSIDIDSIDPAFAPATGTPETGGWSTRELRTILRGLEGMFIVSADIVEVAPAYDTNAELTTMAAADVLYEVLSVMAKTPLGKVKSA
ncbi:putative agmatinase [Mycena kentingensis (nom. inval.)]|nr:putative agmatinase [Mycena kentingensis (nom. inval.)]